MSVTRGDILLTVCQQHLLSQVDMTWKEGRWKRFTEGGREEETDKGTINKPGADREMS